MDPLGVEWFHWWVAKGYQNKFIKALNTWSLLEESSSLRRSFQLISENLYRWENLYHWVFHKPPLSFFCSGIHCKLKLQQQSSCCLITRLAPKVSSIPYTPVLKKDIFFAEIALRHCAFPTLSSYSCLHNSLPHPQKVLIVNARDVLFTCNGMS